MRAAIGSTILCAMIGLTLASCQQAPAPQQTPAKQECSSIEYASAAEAMENLLADPSTKRSIQRGWLLIERREGGRTEFWTFTPQDHPAHPSVGMRTGCQNADGSWNVKTNLICHASKPVCDALLEDYLLLDEQLKQHLQQEYGSGT